MGLYDELTFKDKGRISADFEVSKPQLKKVAHHGAYGFWSSENTHRFVIYMLPYDVSAALVDATAPGGLPYGYIKVWHYTVRRLSVNSPRTLDERYSTVSRLG